MKRFLSVLLILTLFGIIALFSCCNSRLDTTAGEVYNAVQSAFLEKYGKKYEVIDADKLGMEAIDDSCVEYFTPMLFYTMTTVYRTALQDKRRHPLDMRRYMGVVEY